MADNIVPGAITSLPPPPAGWFDYGYAVLWNGELALLRTDFDIHAALARWHDEAKERGAEHPEPDLSGRRLRLSVFNGMKESAAIEVPVGRWAMVDRLPDGRWLVVSGRRGSPSGADARLYAANAAPLGGFDIGNYVTHAQCTKDGTIWAGYFDASVLAVDTTISSAGIARFDADGRLIWRYKDQENGNPFNDDCYAVTADGTTVWSYFSGDFSIVRIQHGAVRLWRNQIAHADAIAVDGDHVLLAGGHREHRSRLALLHLDGDTARQVGMWTFPQPDRNAARLLQGRGATLHVVGSGKWRRITVASLLEGRIYN